MRHKLGESLPSIQKYGVPLEEVTTPSLEALRAYSLGRKEEFTNGSTAALPFYQHAVDLDPSFAMAYVAMAMDDYNLDRPSLGEDARRAYGLRNKVSERERLAIDGVYYLFVTGEWEKAAQVYEMWEQIYPRDPLPYNNLSKIYGELGRVENSLAQALEVTRLDPNRVSGYINLGSNYLALGRLDEAEAAFKQAEEHGLNSEYLLNNRYDLAFKRGDNAQMEQLLAEGLKTPGMAHTALFSQANTEAWYGKLKSSREFSRRASQAALQDGSKGIAALYQAVQAQRETEFGNRELGRATAEAALKLSPNGDTSPSAAIALARAGVTAQPEKIAAELDRSAPIGTRVQEYWLPTIRAAVALARKDPQRAIELLRATSSIENGDLGMYPVCLRGEAYLMLRDGKAAAAEYQRFVDRRETVGCGALARLGLARAYALEGDTVRARAAYQDFLTLWKDADPDIPIYKQAKAEYANLTVN